MLFALVAGSTEPANCGLATMVMWICGSYCEWNKHHEEEAWPDFCCSLLLACSLHPSGCIQEGQGVSHDYLLLGVCHRNSPGSTTRLSCCRISRPSPPPPSDKLYRRYTGRLRKRDNLMTGEGGGGGRGTESDDRKKAWSSIKIIQFSLVADDVSERKPKWAINLATTENPISIACL